MNEMLSQPLIGLALGLILAECTEIAPWLARRVLQIAARRLGSQEAVERYEEEWLGLLDERPGKLMKLFFAIWVALRATWTLRAIHQPHAAEEAIQAGDNRKSRTTRGRHLEITVPSGYTLVTGHSRWNIEELRTEPSRSHLLIILCVLTPILPVGVYALLIMEGLVSGGPLLDWVFVAAAVLGLAIFPTGMSMFRNRTVEVSLVSDDGRRLKLHHVSSPAAHSNREAFALMVGFAPKVQAAENPALSELTLKFDIVDDADVRTEWSSPFGQGTQELHHLPRPALGAGDRRASQRGLPLCWHASGQDDVRDDER
ncbi:hypothetical protein ACFWPV_04630 [Streptomyces uncialis]|uniref:hypothetical protein n=1 Tax=Streptomyces uncialis TaxID=1048205 RepID=UPI00366214E5